MRRIKKIAIVGLVLGGLGLVATIWLRQKSESEETQTSPARIGVQTQSQGESGSTELSRRSRASSPPVKDEPVFERVESILRNTKANDAQTALALLKLTEDSSIPIAERHAALSHAILLTPDAQAQSLVSLGSRSDFPGELAKELLADFHNRSDPWRLAGAVALARHSDPVIRSQSLELVRFLIGAEADETDSEAVLDAATAQLRQMQNE